ncbi:MAG: hypothetical protein BAA01_06060 [Bacillus thermozeamaize]|uniref:Type-5 uracil-DNA glycosylase n=1 Tax=Bacillus thermozeamaize TaxID=230954 RepID=A0A1Y3PBH0_9BACI|nr:MAG: hypothetical protein BAA01_06060 [Bacillus thermozeamaize]
MHQMSWNQLAEQIHQCCRCERLVEWRTAVAGKKREYPAKSYWSRPVSGFGDTEARLLIVGLAPGAHGANRTGRPFTGDAAGDWLYQALYQYGFASQPDAVSRDDGLVLTDVFITNVVRCVPPNNKPTGEELQACRAYLLQEMSLLSQLRVVLALGKDAFDSVKAVYRDQGVNVRGMTFAHGVSYDLGDGLPILMASYHPSRRNTNTGMLTWEMWTAIFDKIFLNT